MTADAKQRRAAALLAASLLAMGAHPARGGPAGRYRLAGEPDTASQIELTEDHRFRYMLAAGALDEQASGSWREENGRLRLRTEPAPVPPRFAMSATARAEGVPLAVQVNWPNGRGVAGVDVTVGFDAGEPATGYTQEDGWALDAGETRAPRWVALAVPMFGVNSPRFPVAAGQKVTVTLTPNDMGVVDFTSIGVEVERDALVVQRGGVRLRYVRVRR